MPTKRFARSSNRLHFTVLRAICVRQFYFRGTVLEISNSYWCIFKIFQTLLHIGVDTPKCYRKTVLPVEFFLSTTSNLLDNRHTNDTMNWIPACLPSLPQVTRDPSLGLHFTWLKNASLALEKLQSSEPCHFLPFEVLIWTTAAIVPFVF